jgi:hypothetical protein
METLKAVTSDLDIYRAANELIKQHGGRAPIHAAMVATDREGDQGTAGEGAAGRDAA